MFLWIILFRHATLTVLPFRTKVSAGFPGVVVRETVYNLSSRTTQAERERQRNEAKHRGGAPRNRGEQCHLESGLLYP